MALGCSTLIPTSAFLFLALATTLPFVRAFEIASSSSPESGAAVTAVEAGGDLELWCNADGWWEWCKFVHEPSGKNCDLKWRRKQYWRDVFNVTVNNCDDFKGRFEYLGDYDNYKCGIRIRGVEKGDAGAWRCELEEYHGYHRRYGDIAEKAFRVEVEEKDEERTSTPRAYPRHNPPPPPRVATKPTRPPGWDWNAPPPTTTSRPRPRYVSVRIDAARTRFPIGGRIDLPCTVNSYSRPTVFWKKNGQRMRSDRRIQVIRSNNTLSIFGATAADTATYTCEADNGYARDSASVSVSVENIVVREECRDNPHFANCKLIVKARYCTNKYYAKFCCNSCTMAGQLR